MEKKLREYQINCHLHLQAHFKNLLLISKGKLTNIIPPAYQYNYSGVLPLDKIPNQQEAMQNIEQKVEKNEYKQAKNLLSPLKQVNSK